MWTVAYDPVHNVFVAFPPMNTYPANVNGNVSSNINSSLPIRNVNPPNANTTPINPLPQTLPNVQANLMPQQQPAIIAPAIPIQSNWNPIVPILPPVLEPTFLDTMGTEMVDIYVGPEKKLFRLYKKVLCQRVPYFDKMFNGGFKEAKEGVATLPEDSVETFDVLVGWVYHGTLRPLVRVDVCKDKCTNCTNWEAPAAYQLANKLCLPELMNRVVDEYIDFQQRGRLFPTMKCMDLVYKLTPPGCGFRKYVSNSLHFVLVNPTVGQNWSIKEIYELARSNEELGKDLFCLIRNHPRGFPIYDPTKIPRCLFHEHMMHEPCYRNGWRTGLEPTEDGEDDSEIFEV